VGPAVLVYDAECSLCRASALWLMRRALAGGSETFEIIPCRSPVRRRRFPQVTEDACLTAMQLVLPDGRVLSGADAVPEILARIPRWRWLGRVFDLPAARPLSRGVYAWVARNRMKLSCAQSPSRS
jgi:predicted DCC family thiol-disulfide oxidoreductase YuxK